MPDEIENHTIRLLQELRAEMRGRFDIVDKRFNAVDKRFDAVDERLEDVSLRADGNNVLLTMLAGLVHRHDERLDKLEEAQR